MSTTDGPNGSSSRTTRTGTGPRTWLPTELLEDVDLRSAGTNDKVRQPRTDAERVQAKSDPSEGNLVGARIDRHGADGHEPPAASRAYQVGTSLGAEGPRRGRGRPNTRARILVLLSQVDHPLVAADIAGRLGLDTKSVTRHLSILRARGIISARSPNRPHGERWPTVYWRD